MNYKIIALLLALPLAACSGSKKEESVEKAGASESEHHEEAIALTPEQLKTAEVELATVGPATIRETLPLYGVIAANAERVREVTARFPGSIRSINVQVGDAVKQGGVLASVESNESLQTYTVTAPLAGVVTARNANPGEQSGEKTLFTVADLSTVWVEVSLFPRDVTKVHVGQTALIRSPDSDLHAEGKVVYVAPFGQSANQTLTARVLLDNAARSWAPGLYVTTDIVLGESSVVRAIRNEAVQNVEGRDSVFVQGDTGFNVIPVRLGKADAEYSEVLDGPAIGERYAARNSFVLKADLGKGEAAHED
jgi:cobalt-zinc-cadmium efflux system membrane fusion protein